MDKYILGQEREVPMSTACPYECGVGSFKTVYDVDKVQLACKYCGGPVEFQGVLTYDKFVQGRPLRAMHHPLCSMLDKHPQECGCCHRLWKNNPPTEIGTIREGILLVVKHNTQVNPPKLVRLMPSYTDTEIWRELENMMEVGEVIINKDLYMELSKEAEEEINTSI